MKVTSVTLEGRIVRLEPLRLQHVEPLSAVALDPELWRWTWDPVTSVADLRRYVETALAEEVEGRSLPFVIFDRKSGAPIGSSRYGNIAPRHRRLEIGWTWVGRAWQGKGANVEAKLLLLTHAFEVLGFQRVEFKTDRLNDRSRGALLALGAREEGVFRKHGVAAGGRIRDTVYYSIIDDEWPEVRR
ncbi:MAG TPA: GNAT family N-acetyltransferase, partial [Gemmatimonadales bacterium]|nr:GNAT family N-acetyltransferase [Gemmatimonadales bacterium]